MDDLNKSRQQYQNSLKSHVEKGQSKIETQVENLEEERQRKALGH